MITSINFDMDGTIANLFEVPNWLPRLRDYDPTPYLEAKVMVNMSRLARYINRARAKGIEVNIISWLSKDSNHHYDLEVIEAKRQWLNKHLPSVEFDHIYITPYGYSKSLLVKAKEGINLLIDDDENNRTEWLRSGAGYHIYPCDMFRDLPKLFD